jgi:hypothetical protein
MVFLKAISLVVEEQGFSSYIENKVFFCPECVLLT